MYHVELDINHTEIYHICHMVHRVSYTIFHCTWCLSSTLIAWTCACTCKYDKGTCYPGQCSPRSMSPFASLGHNELRIEYLWRRFWKSPKTRKLHSLSNLLFLNRHPNKISLFDRVEILKSIFLSWQPANHVMVFMWPYHLAWYNNLMRRRTCQMTKKLIGCRPLKTSPMISQYWFR